MASLGARSPAHRPAVAVTFSLVLAATAGAAGCAPRASAGDLQRAVWSYNEDLRWKRYEQAAAYLPPERRDAFLERYRASEDRLSVESIEVRRVAPVEGASEPSFDVTVVATAYLLPSTVLSRVTIVERWTSAGGVWRLERVDRELAPLP